MSESSPYPTCPEETVPIGELMEAQEKIRRLEDELQRQTAESQAMAKDLEAFIYSVSHDLRGPLRHINGYASLLRDDLAVATPEEIEEYISSILGRTHKMSQLIDALLQFSRVGRTNLNIAPIDLGLVANSVFAELKQDVGDRNIQWRLGDLPVVHGDPSLIRYVMTNLISNALKYSRPRDPAIIEVNGSHDENGHAVIHVRDNGVGFDPRYVDKLFGVFERLHTEREFEGTGIGLANVRRIVERHGGRTWAEGEVDEGATISFSLPPVNY